MYKTLESITAMICFTVVITVIAIVSIVEIVAGNTTNEQILEQQIYINSLEEDKI